jgi:hypothetical protein
MIWFLPGHVQNFRPDATLKETGNVGDMGTHSLDTLFCSILSARSAGGWPPVITNSKNVSNTVQTLARNTEHIKLLGAGYNIIQPPSNPHQELVNRNKNFTLITHQIIL